MVALCSGGKSGELGTTKFSIWVGILLPHPIF